MTSFSVKLQILSFSNAFHRVQVYVHNFMEGERMMRIFNYKTQKHKYVIFQGVDDNNRETLSLELSLSVVLGGG
uniref:Uncharacterized protein n=1 Tax=Cucumis melo TaxID=3656 RepID=A0A9I9ED79_CUCME